MTICTIESTSAPAAVVIIFVRADKVILAGGSRRCCMGRARHCRRQQQDKLHVEIYQLMACGRGDNFAGELNRWSTQVHPLSRTGGTPAQDALTETIRI